VTGPCFLLDEHLPRELRIQLQRREPRMRVLAIGRPGAPAKGTSDPDLLLWIEQAGCWLVTRNRASMPVHLQAHLAAGHHVPGILIIPDRLSWGGLLDQLHLIWGVSRPGEFQDQISYLPLARCLLAPYLWP
jgi:hypothetical protein